MSGIYVLPWKDIPKIPGKTLRRQLIIIIWYKNINNIGINAPKRYIYNSKDIWYLHMALWFFHSLFIEATTELEFVEMQPKSFEKTVRLSYGLGLHFSQRVGHHSAELTALSSCPSLRSQRLRWEIRCSTWSSRPLSCPKWSDLRQTNLQLWPVNRTRRSRAPRPRRSLATSSPTRGEEESTQCVFTG